MRHPLRVACHGSPSTSITRRWAGQKSRARSGLRDVGRGRPPRFRSACQSSSPPRSLARPHETLASPHLAMFRWALGRGIDGERLYATCHDVRNRGRTGCTPVGTRTSRRWGLMRIASARPARSPASPPSTAAWVVGVGVAGAHRINVIPDLAVSSASARKADHPGWRHSRPPSWCSPATRRSMLITRHRRPPAWREAAGYASCRSHGSSRRISVQAALSAWPALFTSTCGSPSRAAANASCTDCSSATLHCTATASAQACSAKPFPAETSACQLIARPDNCVPGRKPSTIRSCLSPAEVRPCPSASGQRGVPQPGGRGVQGIVQVRAGERAQRPAAMSSPASVIPTVIFWRSLYGVWNRVTRYFAPCRATAIA